MALDLNVVKERIKSKIKYFQDVQSPELEGIIEGSKPYADLDKCEDLGSVKMWVKMFLGTIDDHIAMLEYFADRIKEELVDDSPEED